MPWLVGPPDRCSASPARGRVPHRTRRPHSIGAKYQPIPHLGAANEARSGDRCRRRQRIRRRAVYCLTRSPCRTSLPVKSRRVRTPDLLRGSILRCSRPVPLSVQFPNSHRNAPSSSQWDKASAFDPRALQFFARRQRAGIIVRHFQALQLAVDRVQRAAVFARRRRQLSTAAYASLPYETAGGCYVPTPYV